MKSMTGYGTATGSIGKGRLFVEIKSVNHRFCEVSLKLPSRMSSIEGLLRKEIQKRFFRGKIEVFMKEKAPLFGGVSLVLDTELARHYRACFRKLKRALGGEISDDFLKYVSIERFIISLEREGSYERFGKQIVSLVVNACRQVDRMRGVEGKHIARDQRSRLKRVKTFLERIRRQSSRALDQHITRMRRRMTPGNVGGVPLDEQRLQAEAQYLGGRQDIAEELTRLISHADQYNHWLSSHEAVGRKLDFLLQEMNREINTIGAKAADAEISRLVVDCKSELERLREQVQNVE